MTSLLNKMEEKGTAAAADEYFDHGYIEIERIIAERVVSVDSVVPNTQVRTPPCSLHMGDS